MKLKNRLAVLAILAMTAIGVSGGALVSTAAAGNCNANQTAIWYDGSWVWQAQLTGCWQVSDARFYGGPGTGWTGVNYLNGNGGRFYNALQATTTFGYSSDHYYRNYSVGVFGPGCGYPALTVNTQFYFAIKSGSTWGPPHGIITTNYQIC